MTTAVRRNFREGNCAGLGVRSLSRLAMILVSMIAASTHAATLAFPGAEGFGAYAKGGRGGDVYYVTNLNDSGPGSLRAGVEAFGPRTVVFSISGNIELASALKVTNPYLTIAGETAPGGGITLYNHSFIIENTHDVVVRYVRSRLGDLTALGDAGDSINILNSQNLIFDHVSASWGIDENFSASGTYGANNNRDITVQHSIISEGLMNSPSHYKPNHSMGGLWYSATGGGITLRNNVWAHNHLRNPRPGGYLLAGEPGVTIQFVNNVIYNWGQWAGEMGSGDRTERVIMDYINNYLIPGPSTGTADPRNWRLAYFNRSTRAFATIYIDGNVNTAYPAGTANNILLVGGTVAGKITFATAPVTSPDLTILSADEAYLQVLAEAGASLWRDSVDERIINEILTRTGGLIVSQDDVGGWPELPSLPAPLDSDLDGMPDFWELSYRLNPFDPSDRNGYRFVGGYTNLEVYFAGLTGVLDFVMIPEPAAAILAMTLMPVMLIRPARCRA